MRFVAGQVAAMAELLPARTLWRSSIGKTLAAPREPSGTIGRACRSAGASGTIGKMLPSMAQLRCHREEQPVGEAAGKPEGRG